MIRTPISVNEKDFPEEFKILLKDAQVYDSSCSKNAQVYYIDSGTGFFLKKGDKNTLKTEALMTEYFNKKGLSSKVCAYISNENDWLLTEKIKGEDCTFQKYIDEPKRLCDTVAELLRTLHETDFSDCPVKNKNDEYIKITETNFRNGAFNQSFLPDAWKFKDKDQAWEIFSERKDHLKNDVLTHGDYCLPNIILNEWNFSGFIDLGNGGVGNRHTDIFWGIWSLYFNLKTEAYTERFCQAYGKDTMDPELLRAVTAAETFG